MNCPIRFGFIQLQFCDCTIFLIKKQTFDYSYTFYRLELRFPDPSTNLYLLMAAILAAGLDGLSKNIEPLKEERLQLDL